MDFMWRVDTRLNRAREEGSARALPSGLELRNDVEATLEALGERNEEREERGCLAVVSVEIIKASAQRTAGPSPDLSAMGIQDGVARWRASR